MEKLAFLLVNYIIPFLKGFAIFMLVMFVLSVWAKAKEGKLMDFAGTVFNGTIHYIYQGFYYTGIAIAAIFSSVVRLIRIVFATLRDFFMSRI